MGGCVARMRNIEKGRSRNLRSLVTYSGLAYGEKEKPRCFVMDHSFLVVVLRNGTSALNTKTTIAAPSHPCVAPCDLHHGVLLRAS